MNHFFTVLLKVNFEKFYLELGADGFTKINFLVRKSLYWKESKRLFLRKLIIKETRLCVHSHGENG